MMRRALLAALLASVSVPALALDQPKPGTADPHMVQVPYNPLNRTQLVGELQRQTTITFGTDEQIIRVVFGQGEDAKDELWEGPDPKELGGNNGLKNNLPLWPLKTAPTNLQVTTLLPDGNQRVYQFALSAVSPGPNGEDDPDAIFGLSFTYPIQAHQAAVAAWKARQAEQNARTAHDRLATDVFYGVRNWSYVARPNKAWREAGWPQPEVSDNGNVTAFRFEGNVPTPAIYITDAPVFVDGKLVCGPGGNESLAPFGDKDDLKVVQKTAQHFRLRLGEAVMEVCNVNWDHGVGQNPGTGTTSPNVIREVVSAK